MDEAEKNDKPQGNGVLPFVMPRCSTCKFWKQTTFYDYEGAENDGFCSELGHELTIELKNRMGRWIC